MYNYICVSCLKECRIAFIQSASESAKKNIVHITNVDQIFVVFLDVLVQNSHNYQSSLKAFNYRKCL
jgi:hypothetical protein